MVLIQVYYNQVKYIEDFFDSQKNLNELIPKLKSNHLYELKLVIKDRFKYRLSDYKTIYFYLSKKKFHYFWLSKNKWKYSHRFIISSNPHLKLKVFITSTDHLLYQLNVNTEHGDQYYINHCLNPNQVLYVPHALKFLGPHRVLDIDYEYISDQIVSVKIQVKRFKRKWYDLFFNL
jgi:hypothetical protein